MKSESTIEKGKRFEKYVCEQVEEMGLGKAIRTPGSGSGLKKGDVFSNIEFMLECKNEVKPHWWENIDQSKAQAKLGNLHKDKWALIIRDPRTPEAETKAYAMIDLWQFLELLKKNSAPKVQSPDRELKWMMDRARTMLQSIIKRLPE